MRIQGRTGIPNQNGGYYTLPELAAKKAVYCFEDSRFG
jgi:hypothetical protein